jgi:phosphate-selective porin OprO/OprP
MSDATIPLLPDGLKWLSYSKKHAFLWNVGYFKDIAPKRPVFNGGPGAWEAVLRYSYTDLDSKNVHGAKFGRITPMVNWYLSENVRLEMAYGYGHLDRFNLKGNTQFFQTRLQLQFRRSDGHSCEQQSYFPPFPTGALLCLAPVR